MKWFFVITLICVAFILLACNIWGKKREMATETGRSVRHLLTAGAFSILAYTYAIINTWQLGANLGYGIYSISIDLEVMFLLSYVQNYTGIFEKKKFVVMLCYALTAVDGIFMIINVFKPVVFNTKMVMDVHGCIYYSIVDRFWPYYCHYIFVYLMVAFSSLTLIIKTAKTPAIYRIKYYMVLIGMFFVMLVHASYMYFGLAMDYSLLVYAVMALAVFYFTLYYVPISLIETLLAFAVTIMEDGIVCIDIEGKCVYSNKLAESVFQSKDDINAFYREFASQEGRELSSEINWEENRTMSDMTRHFTNTYKPLYDSKKNYVGCFFLFHDNTNDIYKLETEHYRATRDKLTGIYNREYFYEKANARIGANPDTQYEIICMDIKDFKLINDIFGVEEGDEILRKISNRIAAVSTTRSVYGRLAGDRFAICMPKGLFDPQTLLEGAEEELCCISESSVFHVHVQIGIYEIAPDEDTKVEIMCDRAFVAIDTIKNSYQDVIAYYDDKLRESFITEQALLNEFDDALESGQFKMFLQPQTAVTGEVIGGEALVRWLHPERGLIPPGAFIELFERTGLISRLDIYIWECACKQLKQWKEQGRDYHISVNISPKDLYFTDVYSVITGLVERYEIDPKYLRLEITETAIMTNLETELSLIQRLRNKGFAVEIDDFGSGYSSLNTLKDMQVDTIKIDMGFLRKTTHQERSRCILKTIIELSKELGMEVITEGVETKEQVDFLTEFGCDIFQGYYFAKPMPVEDFENKYFEREATV